MRVAHSITDALAQAATLPGEVMVVGGAQVYAAAMPLATEQVLSEIDLEPEGDVLYPDFDRARLGRGRPRAPRGLRPRLPGPRLRGWARMVWAAHLHRTPAGRDVRRPARRRPQGRGARLRGVLPLRPLPRDERRRRARPERRLDDAGRPGPRHQHDPARDHGHQRDLPAARAAGHPGRQRRRDERRPGRAGPRCGVVRGRAHGVRHPVPADRRALRPARGAARRHHRAVVGDRDASATTAPTTSSPTAPHCPSPPRAAATRAARR